MVSILAWAFLIVGLFVTVISCYGVIAQTAALYNVFIGVACLIIGAVLAYLKIPAKNNEALLEPSYMWPVSFVTVAAAILAFMRRES